MSGYDCRNKCVFSFWRNVASDGADWTLTGRLFQRRGPLLVVVVAAVTWIFVVTETSRSSYSSLVECGTTFTRSIQSVFTTEWPRTTQTIAIEIYNIKYENHWNIRKNFITEQNDKIFVFIIAVASSSSLSSCFLGRPLQGLTGAVQRLHNRNITINV